MVSQSLASFRVDILILFLLVTCPTFAHAVNMDACGDRLREAQAAAWNATNPSVPPPPLKLTYEQCLVECGGGFGNISWSVFSQSLITWFIPWVALSFQIPFGAEDPLDDVFAFFLTVGSPALAAYSLQITQLNARWLSQIFSDINYLNSAGIPIAISALQHIPIRLSHNPALLPSLIVLPQNREFWRILLRSAKKIRRWSIPIVVNFVWVVLSALLTIIDTFSTPVPGEIGYGIVTTLAYLLPVTIGWLHVGSEPETNHLRDSLEDASCVALVAADNGDEPVSAERLIGRPKRAIEIVKGVDVDLTSKDELKTNPIYNYARVLVWSQIAETIYKLTRNASVKAEMGLYVDPYPPTVNGMGANVATEGQNWAAHEVICYCGVEYIPSEMSPRVPHTNVLPSSPGSSKSQNMSAVLPLPLYDNHTENQEPPLWAAGVRWRMVLAASLALGLQWGTTGAGLLIFYQMHPVGLGCRTTALMIYGILGTLSFFLMLASSVLAHLSRPRSGLQHRYSRLQEVGAILSRWLGKTLGMIAGLGILLISLVQPLGIFDNCWCSTMTFDRPAQAVAFMTGNFVSQWGVFRYWVGGLTMAFAIASLFGLSIYLGAPRRG